MKTTIDIKDEHKVKLQEIASRRGEQDVSNLVTEAIETYLAGAAPAAERLRSALALRGSLSPEDAEELARKTTRLRQAWR